jgi:hypothetical protein
VVSFSIVELLTAISHIEKDDTGLDHLETKMWLRNLQRALQDEDLVVEIAKRLYEHDRGRMWPGGENQWDDVTVAERNSYVFKALNALDALRDIIAEEVS